MRAILLLMPIILLPACSADSNIAAPFPASFVAEKPGEFRVVTRATDQYPANTSEGETARLAWLNKYVADQGICPSGFDIVDREARQVMSPKVGGDAQIYRSITYTGQCRTAAAPQGSKS